MIKNLVLSALFTVALGGVANANISAPTVADHSAKNTANIQVAGQWVYHRTCYYHYFWYNGILWRRLICR